MKNKTKFYNFARDETTGGRELYIDGDIAEDVWWGDECTPGFQIGVVFRHRRHYSLD